MAASEVVAMWMYLMPLNCPLLVKTLNVTYVAKINKLSMFRHCIRLDTVTMNQNSVHGSRSQASGFKVQPRLSWCFRWIQRRDFPVTDFSKASIDWPMLIQRSWCAENMKETHSDHLLRLQKYWGLFGAALIKRIWIHIDIQAQLLALTSLNVLIETAQNSARCRHNDERSFYPIRGMDI